MVDLSGSVCVGYSCSRPSLEGRPEWAKLCADAPGAPDQAADTRLYEPHPGLTRQEKHSSKFSETCNSMMLLLVMGLLVLAF